MLLRASCSSLALEWEEAAQPTRVLEYAVFYALLDPRIARREHAHDHMLLLGPNPTKIIAPKPTGGTGRGGGRGTRLEITGLHAGTNYTILVRSKTDQGWGPPSEPLRATGSPQLSSRGR